MSSLTVYRDDAPDAPESAVCDWLGAAAVLAHAGILFERWDADVDLPDDAGPEAVLAAYAAPVEALMRRRGYRSRDVVRVCAATPDTAALRRRFLDEHTHAEDEARVFVQGSGCFYLRTEGRVYRVVCERGDVLSVPAGMPHWFDMGPQPRFTAIRLFTRPDGWVPAYTGDPIAAAFPPYDGPRRR